LINQRDIIFYTETALHVTF